MIRDGLSMIYLLLVLVSCIKKESKIQTPLQIAFIADVHLQDIHGDFSDTDYKGVPHPETGTFYTIRTMGAQLHSTRLFNENYFAFIAALDDLVVKGVTLVVLPGDFSDDGQPSNIKALKRIFTEYEEKYGMQFFLITGNHDPVRPFSMAAGKNDFMGVDGREQSVVSDSGLVQNKLNGLPSIVSENIRKSGYREITDELADFGFFPKESYRYWETPYATYDYESYSFKRAVTEASLDDRSYGMDGATLPIPDMSYLVEPADGLWLLALDANVYVPKDVVDGVNSFSGASIGYNDVLRYKSHLMPWVKNVALEAKKRNKTLIAFSHYPMVEFNDGASEEIRRLFGSGMQAHRIPEAIVSETFADAGIQIHFGGHMHLNDTGVFSSKKGNILFNVQVPSLAAYMPGYKLLTLNSATDLDVTTVKMEHIKGYDTFFSLYRMEHRYIKENDSSAQWDSKILASTDYGEYTKQHLKGLVDTRYLPKDWPTTLKNKLIGFSGKQLLLSANGNTAGLEEKLKNDTLKLSDFEAWDGIQMIYDFYYLRNADALAKSDIGEQRLKQYALLCEVLKTSQDEDLLLWGTIFKKSMNGLPSSNFSINLESGTISSSLNAQ